MKKLLLLLLIPFALRAQVTTKGTIISGPAAARPTCSATFNATTANTGDIYNDSDDVNIWKCSGGNWSVLGGGITGVQSNGVTATPEPFINFLSPFTVTTNSGNTSNDIACIPFVNGASHTGGCVNDPGAPVNNSLFLRADNSWQIPSGGGGGYTVNDAVMLVAIDGNDSNNGLSWSSPKATIYNAICSLPLGNCGTQTAGWGTVYVAGSGSGSSLIPANPTSGAGIWLMGASDPNAGSPPTGWLVQVGGFASLKIIGITPYSQSGPNGHLPRILVTAGSRADRNHPSVWISQWNSGLSIENIQFDAVAGFPGRGLVIGECSNNDRSGTCEATNAVFTNDAFAVDTTSGAASAAGPCTDITGNSFWFWFRDFGCNGNAYGAAGGMRADNAAAWLLDGAYLVNITDSNSAAGGIKVKPGSFGASVFVKNFTQEGDFSHALPPSVWYTNWGTQVDGVLENVNSVDFGGGSSCAIENDGAWGGGGPTVIGGLLSPGICGPANLLNVQTFGSGITIPSPMLTGFTGTFHNYLIGESNLAKRIVGLNSASYNNLLSSDPTVWTAAPGGASLSVAPATDPFGGNKAGTVTATGAVNLNFRSGYAPFSGSPGDWVVAGVWIKSYNGNNISFGPCPTNGGGVFSKTLQNAGELSTSASVPDQWDFVWSAGKVSSVTGANVCFLATLGTGSGYIFYGPVQYVIPASAASDDEVAEFVSTMNSVDTNCAVGSICNVSGHPLSVDTLNLRFNTFTGSLVPGTLTGNRTYTFPDVSGTVPMFTGSITSGNNVCASGTAGLITTVGCTGGGGTGTINNALLNSFAYYSAAGTTNTISGINGPTGPANVVEFLTYTPSGGLSGAPGPLLAGIPVRSFSGSPSDTVAATDRNSVILETFGGALTLNVSSTLFGNGFAFKVGSRSSGNATTISPSSGTCNGSSGPTFTNCILLQGENATVTLDASGSNLLADIHEPQIVAGTGITLSRSDTQLTISAPGTGNMSTSSANTMTGTGTIDGSAMATTAGMKVPVGAGAVPTADGAIANNSTNHTLVTGSNGTTDVLAVAATGTNTATTCTNQVITAVSGIAVPTCSTITNAMLTTGTTINNVGVTLGSNTDLASGTGTVHGIMLYEGTSAHPTSTAALTVNQIPVGVASSDPVAGNLSELSATINGADSSGGSTTAYAACPTPAAAALHPGQMVSFKVVNSNTSNNPTLAWCGTTATTVVTFTGAVLANGDMKAGQEAVFLYDGTNYELQNPMTNVLGSSVRWDTLPSASGNATYSNAGFTTTFNQTSSVAWTWGNTTAAVSGTPQNAPTHVWSSKYWGTGPASLTDTITLGPVFGTTVGTNQPVTFTLSHSGTTGALLIDESAWGFVNSATNVVPFTVNALASTTSDLLDLKINSGSRLFFVANDGSATSAAIIQGTRFTSTIATGTAPLTVSSTTQVANLNAATVGGINLGTPVAGGIGYGTSTTQIGTTSAGTAKQVVLSGGTSAPTMIDFPEHLIVPAANCNNATAAAGWSIPASNAPTVACRAGTNNLGGVLQWANNNTTTNAQFVFQLPFDWDTATQPYWNIAYGSGANTSGTVKWTISTACTKSDGSVTDDPAFVAETTSTGKTMAVANRMWSENAQFANLTSGNNCVAGSTVILKVTSGNGTATSTVNVSEMTLTLPRLLTQQAN